MNATAEKQTAARKLRYNPNSGNESHGNVEMACALIQGGEYVYTANYPEKCHGHRYRLSQFVTDVPSYQHKVLVQGLTGPDTGLYFTMAEGMFAAKFDHAKIEAPAPETVVDMPADKGVAGTYHKGSGV